jgi:hypothetical protein
MHQRSSHDRCVADACGFPDGDTLDLRVVNSLRDSVLVRVEFDRSRLGDTASGQPDISFDPSRERLQFGQYADHDENLYRSCRRMSAPIYRHFQSGQER